MINDKTSQLLKIVSKQINMTLSIIKNVSYMYTVTSFQFVDTNNRGLREGCFVDT
jgi:hypothetical protein